MDCVHPFVKIASNNELLWSRQWYLDYMSNSQFFKDSAIWSYSVYSFTHGTLLNVRAFGLIINFKNSVTRAPMKRETWTHVQQLNTWSGTDERSSRPDPRKPEGRSVHMGSHHFRDYLWEDRKMSHTAPTRHRNVNVGKKVGPRDVIFRNQI